MYEVIVYDLYCIKRVVDRRCEIESTTHLRSIGFQFHGTQALLVDGRDRDLCSISIIKLKEMEMLKTYYNL